MTFRKTVDADISNNPAQIRDELLWMNNYIKRDKRSIFDKNMYENEIKYIDDICNELGKVMSYEEFKRKYPRVQVSFLRYLSITSAIPQS